jgi:hypothetical protein
MARSSTSGQGRKKGVPNKSTARTREVVALLAENNVDKMEEWLVDIAKENKVEAFKLMLQVLEYNIPKLARIEAVGDNGGPINHCVRIHFETPPKLNDPT